MMIKKSALVFFLVSVFIINVEAQISHGGIPPGLNNSAFTDDINSIKFDKPAIPKQIKTAKSDFMPMQVAVSISAKVDFAKSATQTDQENGTIVWRLKIAAPEAKAIGLYYSRFGIPEGGCLFIYNSEKSDFIGSFTSETNKNGGCFATAPIPGEEIIIEYVSEDRNNLPEIIINDVAYYYLFNGEKGFGDSGPCEVNVNCTEGDSWQKQKNGVTKIWVKQGAATYLCTGSLINNTRLDNTPYYLTANHCGKNAALHEYNQWIFVFNYQSETCIDPTAEPNYQTIVGARLKSKSKFDGAQGSDFKLLLLNEDVPDSFNPYYNGWSRSEDASPIGTGIHHPQGDIKKISTYTEPLLSVQYEGTTYDPEGKYWKVIWAATETNHGVTEGGSSGSPIFNEDKLIVGALTGGAASCSYLEGPDYYGKFSYSWESNGIYDSLQLKPFLDPDNTGVTSLQGMGINTDLLVALFKTNTDTIAVGERVSFTDISRGAPNKWEWTFEGGSPSSSTDRDPAIKYNGIGRYDVRLIVSNDQKTDTLYKPDLIWVRPTLGPNPASDHVELFFGDAEAGEVTVRVYNMQGSLVGEGIYSFSGESLKMEISYLQQGMYFFEIVQDGSVSVHKLIKVVNQD